MSLITTNSLELRLISIEPDCLKPTDSNRAKASSQLSNSSRFSLNWELFLVCFFGKEEVPRVLLEFELFELWVLAQVVRVVSGVNAKGVSHVLVGALHVAVLSGVQLLFIEVLLAFFKAL